MRTRSTLTNYDPINYLNIITPMITNHPLSLQVKYQDSMDCGGSYLKLVAGGDEEFSSDNFNDR